MTHGLAKPVIKGAEARHFRYKRTSDSQIFWSGTLAGYWWRLTVFSDGAETVCEHRFPPTGCLADYTFIPLVCRGVCELTRVYSIAHLLLDQIKKIKSEGGYTRKYQRGIEELRTFIALCQFAVAPATLLPSEWPTAEYEDDYYDALDSFAANSVVDQEDEENDEDAENYEDDGDVE